MPTLREKTHEVRRSHILEAAAQVFAERGYHRATIKDVARAAGVADGSIYNVFDSKTELLLALLDPLGAAATSDLEEAEPGDRSDRLHRLLQERWDAFSPAMLDILKPVLAEALIDDDLRRQFYQRVVEPVLAPQTASASDDAVALRMLVGAMLGLMLLRLLGDEVTSQHWDKFPERLATLFSSASA